MTYNATMEFRPNAFLILMVDDHSKNLQLLGNVLGGEGYRVAAALNGEQALLSVRKNPPDLILLDVMMPKMDGYAVCRELHESPATRDIPVIFLTARSGAEDVVRGFSEGGVDYITKPFQIQEVLARVRTHLQLKWSKDRLHQFNNELEVMLDVRTQSLIRAEREASFALLVQGIVHNIKTPLAVIQGSAELIRLHVQKLRGLIQESAPASPTSAKHMQAMDDATGLITHASEMLNDMVRSLLTKSRSDKVNDIVSVDLNEVVKAEVEFLKADLFFKHSVAKTLNLVEEALPVQVVPGEIAQVIHNLVRNALDAMHGGHAPALEISTSIRGVWAELTVHDNGSGIPADVLPQIFDPFFTTKGKEGASDQPTGTGLGLHMCQQTIKSYDGEIRVKSAVETGTSFTVRLPLATVKKSIEA